MYIPVYVHKSVEPYHELNSISHLTIAIQRALAFRPDLDVHQSRFRLVIEKPLKVE